MSGGSWFWPSRSGQRSQPEQKWTAKARKPMVVSSTPVTQADGKKAGLIPEEAPEPIYGPNGDKICDITRTATGAIEVVESSVVDGGVPEQQEGPPEEARSAGPCHAREAILQMRRVLGQPEAPGPGDLRVQKVEDVKDRQAAADEKEDEEAAADEDKQAAADEKEAKNGLIADAPPGLEAEEALSAPTPDGSPHGDSAGGALGFGAPMAGAANLGPGAPGFGAHMAGAANLGHPWPHPTWSWYPQAPVDGSYLSMGSYAGSAHGLDFRQAPFMNPLYDPGQEKRQWASLFVGDLLKAHNFLRTSEETEAFTQAVETQAADFDEPDREAVAATLEMLATRVRNAKPASQGAEQNLLPAAGGGGAQGPAEVDMQPQADAGAAGMLLPPGSLPAAGAELSVEPRLPPPVPSEVLEGPTTEAFDKSFQVSLKQFSSDKKWGPKDIKFEWNGTQVEAKVSLKPSKLAGKGAGGKKPESGKLEFRIRDPPDGFPYMNVVLKMGDREIWSQWHLFKDGSQGIVSDEEVNLKAREGDKGDKVEIVVQGFLSAAAVAEEAEGATNEPQEDLH